MAHFMRTHAGMGSGKSAAPNDLAFAVATPWRKNPAAWLMAVLGICMLLSCPVFAVTYYFGVDVPTNLGTNYAPNEIVRSINASYSLSATLASGIQTSALFLRPNGTWLFSPAHPVTPGSTTYEPRDVVAFDSSTYSYFLQGSVAGIPAYARIDAVYLNSAGQAILSFDVPVTLSATDFSQNDLVLYNGTAFSLAWSGATALVPTSSNIVGADVDVSGALVITFDVPTTLDATTYLPGQLVRWVSGSTFSSYYSDSGWPISSQLRDFAFSPPAGTSLAMPLQIAKSGSDLALSWGGSCKSSDSDYEIYEGSLGSYYSHTILSCTSAGATNQTITPGTGSAYGTYYLVVPRNSIAEGSYGRNSSGAEIPPAGTVCVSQVMSCP